MSQSAWRTLCAVFSQVKPVRTLVVLPEPHSSSVSGNRTREKNRILALLLHSPHTVRVGWLVACCYETARLGLWLGCKVFDGLQLCGSCWCLVNRLACRTMPLLSNVSCLVLLHACWRHIRCNSRAITQVLANILHHLFRCFHLAHFDPADLTLPLMISTPPRPLLVMFRGYTTTFRADLPHTTPSQHLVVT
jgi:hypothetical protein